MFPQCKIRMAGMLPCTKYLLLVDFVSLDNFRYKVGKALLRRRYLHCPHPFSGPLVGGGSPRVLVLSSSWTSLRRRVRGRLPVGGEGCVCVCVSAER